MKISLNLTTEVTDGEVAFLGEHWRLAEAGEASWRGVTKYWEKPSNNS
jgi:hypothetical protein